MGHLGVTTTHRPLPHVKISRNTTNPSKRQPKPAGRRKHRVCAVGRIATLSRYTVRGREAESFGDNGRVSSDSQWILIPVSSISYILLYSFSTPCKPRASLTTSYCPYPQASFWCPRCQVGNTDSHADITLLTLLRRLTISCAGEAARLLV
jgi:hypothetical protein